jgi:hypothetical protein
MGQIDASVPAIAVEVFGTRGYPGSIKIDGQEIAKYVRSATLTAEAGRRTELRLDLSAVDSQFRAEVFPETLQIKIREWEDVLKAARAVVQGFDIAALDLSDPAADVLARQVYVLRTELEIIGR